MDHLESRVAELERRATRYRNVLVPLIVCICAVAGFGDDKGGKPSLDKGAKPSPRGPSTAPADPGTVLQHQLVFVPEGTFEMGSTSGAKDAQPVHWVKLDGYFIDMYEVTNAQYEAYVNSGGAPSHLATDATYNGPQQPVVGVSWFDADGYCKWAGLRLPTEAEWEMAARGTDGRIYPWGNERPTCGRAVMDDGGTGAAPRNRGCGTNTTWPVGSKPEGVSPYGAHDMAGNVSEWVSGWYEDYPSGTVFNPTGRSSRMQRLLDLQLSMGNLDNVTRVIRGGSWSSPNVSMYLRSSHRTPASPSQRLDNIGFRCSR